MFYGFSTGSGNDFTKIVFSLVVLFAIHFSIKYFTAESPTLIL